MHPDDQPKLKELMQRVVREKVEFETDYRLVHPDGAVRDIHTTAHPVFSPTGDLIEFMGTVIDVTDRKRAEEELRQSEAYLAEAQKLSHTGSFGWKPDTGEIIWSAETYRIFEYDRAVTPTIDLVAQRVHPEDRRLSVSH
jgi:PAS domain-containing protein